MSTGADTSVRGHIDAKMRRVDRKGGDQTANIEKVTKVEPVVSSNPPKIRLFPSAFFNNIGQNRNFGPSKCPPRSRRSDRPGTTIALPRVVDINRQ
jgi:hypothetical protein